MEFTGRQDRVKDNKRMGSSDSRGNTDITQLMGNSAMLHLNGGGKGVIQRELEAGVSLYRVEERNQKIPMEALGVDTVKITGRSKTGLKSNGKDAQGAHTIADTFIKKYQKEVVKGRPLSEAFGFYESLFQELEADLAIPVHNELDVERSEEAQKRLGMAYTNLQMIKEVNNFKHTEWRKLEDKSNSLYSYVWELTETGTKFDQEPFMAFGLALGMMESLLSDRLQCDPEQLDEMFELLSDSASQIIEQVGAIFEV